MKALPRLLAALMVVFAVTVHAADADDLTTMLHEFLAGVDQKAVHDAFWAEDLVYTSSRGTRTDKAAIMSGIDVADDDVANTPGPVYTAEDIQVQVYGTTAIVAFRLVATPPEGGDDDLVVTEYLNTGTFLRRNGRWQVVAWQATIATD